MENYVEWYVPKYIPQDSFESVNYKTETQDILLYPNVSFYGIKIQN